MSLSINIVTVSLLKENEGIKVDFIELKSKVLYTIQKMEKETMNFHRKLEEFEIKLTDLEEENIALEESKKRLQKNMRFFSCTKQLKISHDFFLEFKAHEDKK